MIKLKFQSMFIYQGIISPALISLATVGYLNDAGLGRLKNGHHLIIGYHSDYTNRTLLGSDDSKMFFSNSVTKNIAELIVLSKVNVQN